MKYQMKNISILCLLLFVISIWYGCEDVIEVEPQFSDPQLVVDAWISNEMKEQKITLRASQQYFDNSSPIGLSGATVTVTRQDGEVFNFTEGSQSGDYLWSPTTNSTLGDFGDQFTLQIEIDGEVFQAESTLNRVPPIDSITQEFEENEVFRDDGIYVQFFARDIEGLGDAYWIKTFKNDTFLNNANQLNIAFDAGFDSGSQVDGIIFIPPIRTFINELDEDSAEIPWTQGERVKVELHSINQEAFNFLEIARDQILNGDNGIFSLPLANTRTNITNLSGGLKPLGMFNVSGVTSLSYTIE